MGKGCDNLDLTLPSWLCVWLSLLISWTLRIQPPTPTPCLPPPHLFLISTWWLKFHFCNPESLAKQMKPMPQVPALYWAPYTCYLMQSPQLTEEQMFEETDAESNLPYTHSKWGTKSWAWDILTPRPPQLICRREKGKKSGKANNSGDYIECTKWASEQHSEGVQRGHQSINKKVTYDSGKGRKVWGMNKSSLIWTYEGLGQVKDWS